MKVLEKAKEAIIHGVAGETVLQMVTQGAKIDFNGQVVPERNGAVKTVNGDANGHARRKREREESSTPPVRDRHDIRYVHPLSNKSRKANSGNSLHNFANEPHRGYE